MKVLYFSKNKLSEPFKEHISKSIKTCEFNFIRNWELAAPFLKDQDFQVLFIDFSLFNAYQRKLSRNFKKIVLLVHENELEEAVKKHKKSAFGLVYIDPKKNYLQILPVLIDKIIHLQDVEEQLEIFKSVVLNVDDGVLITEATQLETGAPKITFLNDAFTKITGYTLAELSGKSLQILRGPNTDSVTIEKINKAFNQQLPIRAELINYRKDKKEIWIELVSSPVMDVRGNVKYWVSIQRDITKRKIAEQEIRKLSLVASKTDNSIMITDQNGLIEWVNEGFTKLSGYELKDVIGTRGEILRKGKQTGLSKNNPNYNTLSKTTSISYEVKNYTKSGKAFWVSTLLTPVFHENGQVEKIIAIDSDITERVKFEKVLEKKQKELEQSFKALSDSKIEIELAHSELARQNRKIKESINYAQRIQDSLFQNADSLKKIFKNSFLLNLPRDVVSGDFFWMHQDSDRVIMAVADCTGHGVPGAFMSLIGNFILNEIVQLKEIISPCNILNHLNHDLENVLHGNHMTTKSVDGMELAICSIQKRSKKLIFSGAHRPMYFYRSGKLTKYSGDLDPIGGSQKYKQHKIADFTDIEINFKKGDRFFLLSDGFTDQFGGPENRRFDSTRFIKFLDDNMHLSMDNLYNKLSATLQKWKGAYKQTDDIIVAGVEL